MNLDDLGDKLAALNPGDVAEFTPSEQLALGQQAGRRMFLYRELVGRPSTCMEEVADKPGLFAAR